MQREFTNLIDENRKTTHSISIKKLILTTQNWCCNETYILLTKVVLNTVMEKDFANFIKENRKTIPSILMQKKSNKNSCHNETYTLHEKNSVQ